MKKAILIACLLLVYGHLFSQAEPTYAFKNITELQQCDEKGNPKGNTVLMKKDWIFSITRKKSGNAIIQLLEFRDTTMQKIYNIKDDSPVYFLIEEGDLEVVAYERLSTTDVAAGLLTLPMKLRIGKKDSIKVNDIMTKRDFDVNGEINVGGSFGLKCRFGERRSNAVNFLLGGSVGGLVVDSTTTNGRITDAGIKPLGFTFHGSIVLEVKGFQVFVSNGIDLLGRELGKNWVYQRGHWLGFGIGVNLYDSNFEGKTQKP